MQKSLDEKLARIAANPSCNDFILADAKDADMAFGIAAPGVKDKDAPEHKRYRTIQEFRAQIREIVDQKLVDIMLMSASTSDVLAVRERIFDKSPITPAIRANDTTDIWLAGSQANYGSQPSLPFRTAILDEVMDLGGAPVFGLNRSQVNLGLYSITFNNDATLDRAALEAYRAFREEAWKKDFRHFLEVFVPNAPVKPVARRPAIRQRQYCPAARRGGAEHAADFPQDSVFRSGGAGAARQLRFNGCRGNSWRICRDNFRRISNALGSKKAWSTCRSVRPQNQQCRPSAFVRNVPAPIGRR